jgi:hypothetical protein
MGQSLSRRKFVQGMGAAAASVSVGIGRHATAAPQRPMRGQTYHIDPAAGDDANDGLTPARPLKTYAAREFTGGDAVLFKRGRVIRDVLHTRAGATAGLSSSARVRWAIRLCRAIGPARCEWLAEEDIGTADRPNSIGH